MTTVKRVEAQIKRLEGFDVRILRGGDFRDVRSDKHSMPAYAFERAAKGSMRVGAWERRFREHYPGLAIEVLRFDGKRADGRMQIATVRSSYESN